MDLISNVAVLLFLFKGMSFRGVDVGYKHRGYSVRK